MSKLIVALMISVFSIPTFSASAANNIPAESKKVNKTHIQNLHKKSYNDFNDMPLTNNHYEVQNSGSVKTGLTEGSPIKPTEVDYIPPPNLNDRNPISN